MRHLTYVIIDADDVPSVAFAEVFETSVETLRYDNAGTKTIVKFKGSTPSFLEGKTQYTHSQILAIVSTSSWTGPLL